MVKTKLNFSRKTWGFYYKSRFGVNEVTSGSTQGFLYHDGGSLVTGVDRHGNTC